MSIPVHCPKCRSSFQVPDQLSSKEVNCMSCGHRFFVAPEMQSATEKNASWVDPGAIQADTRPIGAVRLNPPTALPLPTTPASSPRKSSQTWIWLLVGGGLAAATLFLGVVALMGFWFLRPMAQNPGPIETVVAEKSTPVALPAPPPAEAPKPVGADVPGPEGDNIPLPVLQSIKNATVFIKAETSAAAASGTGFLVQVQGETAYIATNHHVIAAHTVERPGPRVVNPRMRIHPIFPSHVVRLRPTLTLVFDSGTPQERSGRAEVVADDSERDLAILKIAGIKDLPRPIDLISSPRLIETMPIYTFGFPFGKALATNKSNPAITVGKGIISSVRVDEHGQLSLVQIDGALNPGNSGGPVVDRQGRLVGVAVATIKGSSGIGLAIPPQELGKVLSGRVASMTLARRKRNTGNTDLIGEIWMINSRNQITTTLTRTTQVSAPGQKRDASADREAELLVEVQFLDPLNKIRGASVSYLRFDQLKLAPQMDRDGSWTPLPGAQTLDLQRDDQLGQNTIRIATSPETDEHFFQVAYRLSDGKSIYTQPRSFRLNRTAPPNVTEPTLPNQPNTVNPRLPKKKQYSEEELTRLLADLRSTDFFRCKGAVDRLRETEPNDKRRSEVARALEITLNHGNVFVRRESARALGVWGDADSTPVLLKRIGPEESDVFLKRIVIEVLGLLKNEKAAAPVVACLGDFFLREQALRSLRSMGVVAEKALLQALEHLKVEGRIDACTLLKEFGTKASLPVLELARKDSNAAFAQAAREAWQAIRDRSEKS